MKKIIKTNVIMKKSFRLFLVFSVVLMIPLICQAFDKWPDTGQTTSYTDTFGEDSDYTINPQSYTKLGAGGVGLPGTATTADGWIMTRDNVTGLIWEVKTDDGSIHDKENTYTWCDTNSATNGGDPGTCGDGTDTTDFITAANNETFGGFSDWRLPTVKELSTLVNSGRYNPAINTTFFPNTVSARYWSSTTYALYTDFAWSVYFGYGNVLFNYGKDNSNYVRSVRGGQ